VRKIVFRDAEGTVVSIGGWDMGLVHVENPNLGDLTEYEIKKMLEKELKPHCLYDSEYQPVLIVKNPIPDGVTSKIEDVDEGLDMDLVVSFDYKSLIPSEYPTAVKQLDYIHHHGIEKWKKNIIDPIRNKHKKPT